MAPLAIAALAAAVANIYANANFSGTTKREYGEAMQKDAIKEKQARYDHAVAMNKATMESNYDAWSDTLGMMDTLYGNNEVGQQQRNMKAQGADVSPMPINQTYTDPMNTKSPVGFQPEYDYYGVA